MHASSSVCLLCKHSLSFFVCMHACLHAGSTFHCLSMHDMYCRLSKMCASASAISSLGILQGSLITKHPKPAKILQRLFGSKRVECCKHAAKPWTTRFIKQGRPRPCLSTHAQAFGMTGEHSSRSSGLQESPLRMLPIHCITTLIQALLPFQLTAATK